MQSKIIVKNTSETKDFALKIAKTLKSGDILCLAGDLGTGKTFIAKEVAKYFKVDDEVISPTFNILKIYNTDNAIIKKILHFDLYRIKNIDELINIGFEDYIYSENSVIIIEWPEVSYDLLPKNTLNIMIKYDKNDKKKRTIIYEKR